MGFFSELKQDLSQAVNELVPEEESMEPASQPDVSRAEEVADTLEAAESPFEEANDEGISLADMLENIDSVVAEEANEPVIEEESAVESIEVEQFVAMAMADEEEAKEEEVVEEVPEVPVENKVEKEERTIMDTFASKVISDETSVITNGMKITGDIYSEGSLDVIGTVNGNIDILGKLNITGHVNGDSKANEIYAEGAQINGEVVSEGAVKVGQNSVIIGNITATSAAIAGAVKGDIDVKGPVILDATAIVMGNIKSKSVQINVGAVIEGNCSQCYAEKSPTVFFDEYKPEVIKKTASKGTK